MVNFYEILGIDTSDSDVEIIKAYKIKAKLYHPDTNGGHESAIAMFKLITLAKETLLESSKRLEHDYAVGIKNRTVPTYPNSITTKSNTDEIIGFGLLAFIAGLALSSKE